VRLFAKPGPLVLASKRSSQRRSRSFTRMSATYPGRPASAGSARNLRLPRDPAGQDSRMRLAGAISAISLASLTACTGSSSRVGEPQPTPSSVRPSPSAQHVAAQPAPGCPPSGAGVPPGAVTATPLDVDADGRADTVWAAGTAPAWWPASRPPPAPPRG
jgi:hypothetical protein